MAQPFASGAVHCYAAFHGGTPFYLGTCESMPNDSRSPEYELLQNDISGSKNPLDLAFQGMSAQISLIVTRQDWLNLEALEYAPGENANVGEWSYEDVGTLMALEGEYTRLWLAYTFGASLANKTVYTSNGMIRGRYYPQCVMWSPQTDETGTRPMKRQYIFYAWPKYNPTTRMFTLYSTQAADFTGISANLIT